MRILTICPYRLLPLRGGGALRCFHLLRQLARFHEVHAIVFQREEELRRETDGYKVPDNVRIYSPLDTPPPRTLFDRLPRRLGPGLHYRWMRRSWRGPAESTLLRCHHLLREVLARQEVDVMVFEHLSTMAASPVARRVSPAAVQCLDAHNVDHRLLAQEIDGQPNERMSRNRRRSLATTEWTERHLGRFVHGFCACSDDDRRVLEACSGLAGYTVPNGVDTAFFAFDANPTKATSKCLLYSGWMGTRANQDGIAYFAEDIWPLILEQRPDLDRKSVV